MMCAVATALGLAAGGCFNVDERPCSYACGPNGECPDNYMCLGDGYCHLHGQMTSCGYSDLAAGGQDGPIDLLTPDFTADDGGGTDGPPVDMAQPPDLVSTDMAQAVDMVSTDMAQAVDMVSTDMAISCGNGVRDGTETDVDCGGSCAQKCALTQGCSIGGDCASGFCTMTSHVCVATQCQDQTKNGSETDVDCGGSCPSKCGLTQGCMVSGDCTSTFCAGVSHVCVADACHDETTNGAETDVDCGGGTCPTCGLGKACAGLAFSVRDCTSMHCSMVSNVCVATQCQDQAMNGAETDVDCGGGTCPACATGKMCMMPSDCVSGNCMTMTCSP
jgi:hypothetical protein